MKHTLTFTVDLTETKDVLHDYFGTTVPDEFLLKVINGSGQLTGEILDQSIGDTCARELLIDEVVKNLPDYTNQEWPLNGYSQEVSNAFFVWFTKSIEQIGGTVDNDD